MSEDLPNLDELKKINKDAQALAVELTKFREFVERSEEFGGVAGKALLQGAIVAMSIILSPAGAITNPAVIHLAERLAHEALERLEKKKS